MAILFPKEEESLNMKETVTLPSMTIFTTNQLKREKPTSLLIFLRPNQLPHLDAVRSLQNCEASPLHGMVSHPANSNMS